MLAHQALIRGTFAVALIGLIVGCDGIDYKTRGKVKGVVTTSVANPGAKGQTKRVPLTSGTVMFQGPNGISASATINTKGEYDMQDAPIGDCQVTVSVSALPMDPGVKARLSGKGPKMPEMKNPEAQGTELPSAPEVPKEIVRIDEKYSKTESSGLKFTIKKGESHVYNIDL
jgi:hypothetical protein